MLFDILLDIIVYRIGYIFVKIVKLGRFPRKFDEGGLSLIEIIVVLISVAILVLLFYLIY